MNQNKKTLKVILVFFLALIIGLFGFYFFKKDEADKICKAKSQASKEAFQSTKKKEKMETSKSNEVIESAKSKKTEEPTLRKEVVESTLGKEKKFFLKPEKTALLIIDFQNFRLDKKGFLSKSQIWKYLEDNKTIEKTKTAIEKARKAGATIIFLKTIVNSRMLPETEFFKEIKKEVDFDKLSKQELEWNFAIVDGIEPQNGDYIITKGCWTNGFRDTNLRTVLKLLKIDSLILTGALEPTCVYGTFLGAFDEGFQPVVLIDTTVPGGSNEKIQKDIHDFSKDIFYPMMGAKVISSEDLEFR